MSASMFVKGGKAPTKNSTILNKTKAKDKMKCSSSSSFVEKNRIENCVESLKELKNTSKYNLDDRIKFLKSELKSLVKQTCDSNTDKGEGKYNISVVRKNFDLNSPDTLRVKSSHTVLNSEANISKIDDDLLVFNENESVDGSVLKRNNNTTLQNDTLLLDSTTEEDCLQSVLKPMQMSTESSKWLSTTIDIIDATVKKSPPNNKYFGNDLQTISDKNFDLLCKESKSCSSYRSDFKNISRLSHDKIESLVYKSFVMQNLDKCSSSVDNVQEIIEKSNRKNKTERSLFGGSKKKIFKGKQNLKVFSKKRRRKHKRNLKRNHDYSDVNTITLSEGSSTLEFTQLSDASVDCLALATENINWDEPFDIDNKISSSSDSSVMETAEFHCDEPSTNDSFLYSHKGKDVESVKIDQEEEEREKVQPQVRIWECPICLEKSSGQEIITTLCGHIFCKACIQNYKLTSQSCPSCRTDLSDKPLITLFNF